MSNSKGLPPLGGEDTDLQFRDFMGQSALIEKLASDFQLGQFVHAYLFAAAPGVGKRSLAMLCIQTLYCTAAHKPCGQCNGCRRVAQGNVADVHTLRPDGASLKVNQIRELIETVQLRPFEGGTKAVLIEEAQRMTPQAQNCLLKTLEQPPGDTVFFLLCESTGGILPTVLSRCRVISLRPLSDRAMSARLAAHGIPEEQAQRVITLAQGSVGRALELLADQERLAFREQVQRTFWNAKSTADILNAATGFKGERAAADDALRMLQEALAQAMRDRLAGNQTSETGWLARADVREMLSLHEGLVQARKMLASNVQSQMVMETILLEITEEQAHDTGSRHPL